MSVAEGVVTVDDDVICNRKFKFHINRSIDFIEDSPISPADAVRVCNYVHALFLNI